MKNFCLYFFLALAVLIGTAEAGSPTTPSSAGSPLSPAVGITAALPALTNGSLWIGNSSNVATAVAMSGSCTITNAGVISCTSGAAAAGTLTGTTLAANVAASSLTSLGTIVTGVWNGTLLTGTYGGTGINNGSKTVTLGGSLVTTGTATPSLAFGTGANTYTFQNSSDTIVGRATTDTLTNKTISGASNTLTNIGTSSLASGTGATSSTFWRGDGTWAAPATTGTVTSVTFTGDGTILSSTPSSAVTASGTLTAALANAAANTVLGNNTGSSAAPGYQTSLSIASGTLSTSLTSPLVAGGTTASSVLTLESTSGAGTTDEIDFKTASQSLVVVITSGGKVGIGGTSSANVTKNLSLSGEVGNPETFGVERRTTAASAGNGFTISGGGAIAGSTNLSGGNMIIDAGQATGNSSSSMFLRTTGGGSSGTSDAANINQLTMKNNSTSPRISVGTTAISPSMLGFTSLLEAPAISVIRNPSSTGAALTINSGSAASGGTNLSAGNLVLQSGISTGSGTGAIVFNTSPGSAGSTSDNTLTEAMRITGAQLVGIGTATPQATLDVRGTVKTFGYTVATLPTGVVGMRTYVTDQLTTCAVAGAALTGGGAKTCPVFYDGTAWGGD